MSKWHEITEARIEDAQLKMRIDGHPVSFDRRSLSPRLARAADAELAIFEISPRGYGIHWPLLDEDLSIDGLLGIVHSPECEQAVA